MLHLVFSGPEQATSELVDAIGALGYPVSEAADRGGFDAEHLTGWVEVVADAADDRALVVLVDVAAAAGFRLRLHSVVEAPRAGWTVI